MCFFLWGELQKRAGEEHMNFPSCSSCIPEHSQCWTVPCLSIHWAAFMGHTPTMCVLITFLLWDTGKSFKEYICYRVQLCKEKSDLMLGDVNASWNAALESSQCKGRKTMDNIRGRLHARAMHLSLMSSWLGMAKTCWRGEYNRIAIAFHCVY